MATKTSQGYFDCNLKTPEGFVGTKPDSKVLVVASGESTSNIIKYKDELRSKFDAIICLNYSFKEFESVSDFHIIVERQKETDPISVPWAMNDANYRTDIPRLVNWQGAEMYDKKYNLYKTTRSDFFFKPDIRKYSANGSEGFLCWTQKSKGWASGTAALAAMHFATILGADEIYIIGCDLHFRSEYDHFYKDKIYRNKEFRDKLQSKHLLDIIDVKLGDKIVQTTDLFKDSAETINELIPTVFGSVKIFDFSDGLITSAIPLDLDEFMRR